MHWLQYLSFFNYAFEALIVNELKDVVLRDRDIVDVEVPGEVILLRFGFDAHAYWRDVRTLAVLAATVLVLAFVGLKLFVKERR